MVLSEGVPPDIRIEDWYTEMFSLKEKRLTFMEDDLIRLMTNAGFEKITTCIFVAKQRSVRNWLENSGLPIGVQNRIYQMHVDLSEYGKNVYKMVELPNDLLIDMKFFTVVGVK